MERKYFPREENRKYKGNKWQRRIGRDGRSHLSASIAGCCFSGTPAGFVRPQTSPMGGTHTGRGVPSPHGDGVPSPGLAGGAWLRWRCLPPASSCLFPDDVMPPSECGEGTPPSLPLGISWVSAFQHSTWLPGCSPGLGPGQRSEKPELFRRLEASVVVLEKSILHNKRHSAGHKLNGASRERGAMLPGAFPGPFAPRQTQTHVQQHHAATPREPDVLLGIGTYRRLPNAVP